jgi:hypothetical protein
VLLRLACLTVANALSGAQLDGAILSEVDLSRRESGSAVPAVVHRLRIGCRVDQVCHVDAGVGQHPLDGGDAPPVDQVVAVDDPVPPGLAPFDDPDAARAVEIFLSLTPGTTGANVYICAPCVNRHQGETAPLGPQLPGGFPQQALEPAPAPCHPVDRRLRNPSPLTRCG